MKKYLISFKDAQGKDRVITYATEHYVGELRRVLVDMSCTYIRVKEYERSTVCKNHVYVYEWETIIND